MIELKNVTFGYPGSTRDVYEDFSISLLENKIYGLLGKNGMGKSTLLYLICGLLRASSGKIAVNGYDAQLRRPEMLRELMIVPEEFELPKVTLDEYVMINAPFYPRFSKDVLVNCLQNFELPLSLRLDQLSMGQKKKVYMSFALAANTKYLLMDEPTNGLDIPSKSQFRKVVASNMSEVGIFDVDVKRFQPQKHEDKVPAMGWNEIYDLNMGGGPSPPSPAAVRNARNLHDFGLF